MGNQTQMVNETRMTYPGYNTITTKTQGYTYEGGTGRLLESPKAGQTDTIKYDGAGNQIFHRDNSTSGTASSYHRDRASYYSADGKLAAAETRHIGTGDINAAAIFTRVFEEFRYDALGRRIWSRSRNWCERDPDGWEGVCRQSKLRRMVWDGDEELYEIQMPGGDSSTYLENDTAQVVLPSFTEGGQRVDQTRYYGRVAYTHALGIDQPIAITRMGYADRVNDLFFEVPFLARPPFMVSPLWNERGQMYSGTFANGSTESCQAPSGVGADTIPRCIHFGSPASWFAYDRPKHKASVWQGSLLQDRAEESGILYRRNRYYDPEKGKFTQEDPIGLNGGVNLYGFSSGDPVNFSDPFGLETLVNCRPVGGAGKEGKIGHCAVRVVDKERKLDVTIELIPLGRKNRVYWSSEGDPRTKKFDPRGWVQIGVPEGMSAREFDDAVLTSAFHATEASWKFAYQVTGNRNSNRFVFDVITSAGGRVPRAPSLNFRRGAPGLCGGEWTTGTQCAP